MNGGGEASGSCINLSWEVAKDVGDRMLFFIASASLQQPEKISRGIFPLRFLRLGNQGRCRIMERQVTEKQQLYLWPHGNKNLSPVNGTKRHLKEILKPCVNDAEKQIPCLQGRKVEDRFPASCISQ